MNKQKIIIVLTVFIDIVGFGLVLPTLPLYVERFGASPFIATTYFAVYSLCQFFAAPLMGSWSDRIGRRPVLILSLFGTAIGWFVFALANTLPLLFLGRILDGITGGNISTAQSYLVDIAKTDKERTENLGLIGAAFGMGFVLGPALGAALSHFGTTTPFWVAGVLSLANAIAAYFFLPETHLNRKNSGPITLNPFKPIIRGFKNKKISLYLLAWFLFSLGFTNLQTILTLYVNREFGFNETQAGYLLATIGLIIAFNQGFFLKKFWLKYFSEPALEIVAVVGLMLSYLGLTAPIFSIFLVSLIVSSFAQSILRVVSNSQIAGNGDPNKKGELMGVVQGLTSLAAIVIPPLSGLLFERYIQGPWYMSTFFMVLSLLLILKNRKKISKTVLVDSDLLS